MFHIELVLVALLVGILFIMDLAVHIIRQCLRHYRNRKVEFRNSLNDKKSS